MIIVLCGYMGSGKSLIGRKLANELGFSFQDLDDEIEKEEKMKISQIFSEKGEIAFRKIEIDVLERRLKSEKNLVLALGGGTPCYGNNLETIKSNPDTHMIYLKVNLDTLTQRLFSERAKRPLLHEMDNEDKLYDYIRKHLFERQYYYMQSDFFVEASAKTPAEIVTAIKTKLEE